MSTMTIAGLILLAGAALSVAFILGLAVGMNAPQNEDDDPSFLDTDS
jgi:hypothetical protein